MFMTVRLGTPLSGFRPRRFLWELLLPHFFLFLVEAVPPQEYRAKNCKRDHPFTVSLAIFYCRNVQRKGKKLVVFQSVLLGTGRLTIAHAIYLRGDKGGEGEYFIFWTRFGKLNLENFKRKRKSEYCLD